jgi:hypothetical protein
MSLQETKRAVERARDKGDQTGVVAELGVGALTAAAGLWGTKALAKNLASRIKPRTTQIYSQAEYDRILREGAPKQLSAPPAPPKLLNGPTEQRLLNAPAREKTVFEMQQEIAQKNAMLPKSQYGLELPPGNTAAQRAAAMGFGENYIHSTHKPFSKIEEGGKFSGIFTLPDRSANYGNVDMPLVLRGNIASDQNLNNLVKNPSKKEQRAINQELSKNTLDISDATVEMQKLRNELARKHGYSGVMHEDEFSDTVALVSPDNTRSRFAAFDPHRLSAAIAAATGSFAPDLLAEEYANGGEVTADDLILIERKR